MNLRPLTPTPPPPLPEPTDYDHARADTAERVLALTMTKIGTHVALNGYEIYTDHNREQVEVPTHALDTIRQILSPLCHDNAERVDQLIRDGISSGRGLTVTWLHLRTEWAIDDALFTEEFDAIDSDGYLDVRQQRDGTYIVTAHESRNRGDIVRLVLPAGFVRDLALDDTPQ